MIRITEKAKERMIDALIDEGASLLRFGLRGGGCNGFSYYFEAEYRKEDDDYEFPLDNERTLVIDAASMMYLTDAEIDYKKDIMGESFVFNNPNTKGSCGCGSSVSF